MIEKIIGMFGTRIIQTLLTLVIIIINTHSFGSEGVGIIGLFVLNITILQMFSSFVGGSSLVYMTPRCDNFQLIFLSYMFAILTNGLGTLILYKTGFVSFPHVWHLLASSFFLSLFSVNALFLLSKENIKLYNIINLTQIIIHLMLLIILLFVCKLTDVSAYMYSYEISYMASFVLSLHYVIKAVRYKGFKQMFGLFGQMFKYGFLIQIANISQLLNYRMSYYVIQFMAGVKPLGVFDLGTKLSEAIWILPKSISTVQYTRISNCGEDKMYAKKVTLSFFKLTFIFAITATMILFCIPTQWIGWVFGNEFIESKKIIYALGCGIVVLSCNIILSHYFSGFGKYKINAIASLTGLIVTAGLSIAFIFGTNKELFSGMDIIFIMGLITSFSYLSSFVCTLIYFVKDTGLKPKELKITRQDISIVKTEIKKKIRKHFMGYRS